MIGASVSFALMALFVKRVSVEIPEGEVVLFRSVIALAIAFAVGVQNGSWKKFGGVSHGMLVTRGLIGCASMFAYFFAIKHLKLGDAVLLTYMSPLFVSMMSPFVLGERVPKSVWIALAIGLGGVAAVGIEETANESAHRTTEIAGVAAAVASAILAAAAYVSVRKLARTDDSTTIVLWFSAIACVLGGATAASGSLAPSVPMLGWVTPSGVLLRDLLLIGICAAVAQLLMTQSYAVSQAARVSVYGYVTPVLSYLLALGVLHEKPGITGVIGTALVLLAGVLAGRVQASRAPA